MTQPPPPLAPPLAGLRVLDIVPDGVVLDHRGNTFKVSIDP